MKLKCSCFMTLMEKSSDPGTAARYLLKIASIFKDRKEEIRNVRDLGKRRKSKGGRKRKETKGKNQNGGVEGYSEMKKEKKKRKGRRKKERKKGAEEERKSLKHGSVRRARQQRMPPTHAPWQGCPEMYGLPKIHKPDVPFLPIVSSIQSITYHLCSYLKRLIQPLVGHWGSAVTNCKAFVEQIRLFRPSSSDILVSYDVKDLFTSIPIPYTLNVLQDLLYTDQSFPERTKLSPFQIVQLVSFCMLKGNFFHFQGRFYKQQSGAPMGSPLSPVLADVLMEYLEDRAFSEADHTILSHFFKRCVDDIFVIIESGQEDRFLTFLNELFPNTISLTIEKEVADCLKTTVYRKPTHSDSYLHFSSHQPQADNGYPASLAHSVIQKTLANPQRIQNRTITGPRTLLPYYKRLSERVQRLGRTLNFSVCYQRGPNLRALLRGDKVRLASEEHAGVVYAVKCSCSALYIGETGFSLTHRFREHMKHLARYNRAKQDLEGTSSPQTTHRGRPPTVHPTLAMEHALAASAVAEHAARCRGSLQTKVVCKESRLSRRRIKEAFFI
ncbi:hypothetical protein M514_12999 [Trichuris suis]|uniref:Reverse transcriptase domain-containing protein n=1 Tax=Trichuris suis TaxID=68888 RepID=A0A085N4X0_9BILA|nr:hypothetical protein M514_12999 [Trichuris suis]